MPICPITGLSFEHHELERRHYERFGFPVPDIHPIARFVSRLCHGNNWSLYWTVDARTGKKLLSCHDPKDGEQIVDHHYWMSDEFDAREYGREFDFSRGFFEQYFEMVRSIPKPNVTIVNCTNVEYANHVFNSKNCYLCFICLNSENILYSFRSRNSRDCLYIMNSRSCELCYQCIHCTECYDVQFAEFSSHCSASRFLSNCNDCIDCYQCANLKSKQYCIQNIQYTKDGYEAKMKEIDLSSYVQFQKECERWQAFLATQPIQAERNIGCEDSTGTFMTNCQSCIFCSNLTNSENCVNSFGNNTTEGCDTAGENSQYGLMNVGFIESQNVAYTLVAEHCYAIQYSQYMIQSHDCFGCYGLHKVSFCILNKEYAPEEYNRLQERIAEHMKKTGEWGKFFPPQYSPFFYDDTNAAGVLASEFDDCDMVALAIGMRVRDTKGEKNHDAVGTAQMSDRCDEYSDSALGTVWACEKSGAAYKVTSQELRLYQRMRVPVPRISWRAQFELYSPMMYPVPHKAACVRCGKDIYSYIHPRKTARKIFCDSCFEETRN
ncbi:MAG: hypothetical protein Q8P56_05395 [Candidatus Uhrbacteria bacterium]|nr:hypothetical protein [Candidatus Uhrbacteria bacterium]